MHSTTRQEAPMYLQLLLWPYCHRCSLISLILSLVASVDFSCVYNCPNVADRADVKTWWTTHAGRHFDRAGRVDEGDIQALEKAVGAGVPEELRSILLMQDGDIWFSEKRALKCEAIAKEALEMERSTPGWRPGLIPFAKDMDGTLLVTDSRGRTCPVEEWDMNGQGMVMANDLSLFLEDYRNNLLSGRFEYVDGVGVVEKMSRSSPRRGK